MRTRATITLTAALALAVTGCSSGDESDDAAPATSTASSPAAGQTPAPDDGTAKADLEEAVRDYTAALFSGDESGYAALSERCKKTMTKASWVGMAEGAHQQYGAQKATDVKVDQLSGDLARVSYGAGNIPQFEREGQPWVREGGAWRWDACPSTG
ncbi:hypothetical protein ACIQ6R_06305 [Streptomyces sp. NPDC096048]|uniref:nuclear transport factor 2 family protein n=1 Tax=Streptomyces sp. NPDC096048 TaxID=3366072 RepID=UPI003814E57D